jgi:hypothetical protein
VTIVSAEHIIGSASADPGLLAFTTNSQPAARKRVSTGWSILARHRGKSREIHELGELWHCGLIAAKEFAQAFKFVNVC